jgi:hypothetical protein
MKASVFWWQILWRIGLNISVGEVYTHHQEKGYGRCFLLGEYESEEGLDPKDCFFSTEFSNYYEEKGVADANFGANER